eukprot:6881743-Alexandrium_andersonii.AAC.1
MAGRFAVHQQVDPLPHRRGRVSCLQAAALWADGRGGARRAAGRKTVASRRDPCARPGATAAAVATRSGHRGHRERRCGRPGRLGRRQSPGFGSR